MARATVYLFLAAVVCGIAFAYGGWLDLACSRLFYSQRRGFPFAGALPEIVSEHIVPWLAWAFAAGIVALLVAILVRKGPVLGLRARHVAFLALSLAVGPGLIVNGLLKPYSGRPRPIEIARFGGTLDFRPAFDFGGDCTGNCSFVSGDASVGFAFVAVALLVPRRRAVAVGGAVALGAGIGLARVVAGAHFLSDIVFAGFVTVLPILALYWLMFEARWPSAVPRPG
jgi:lipid A 4'-phosphatase